MLIELMTSYNNYSILYLILILNLDYRPGEAFCLRLDHMFVGRLPTVPWERFVENFVSGSDFCQIPGENLMNCSWIIHEYCSWIFLINSWTIHEYAWTLNGRFMKFIIHEQQIHEHFSSWTVHELKLAKRFMNIHEQFMNIVHELFMK